jgi:hypothetical protein
MSSRRSTRNSAGVVLPTRLMVLSISAVALAGLTFFATQGDNSSPDKATPAASSEHTPGLPPPDHPAPATITATPTPPKPVNKAKTTVVIFNNTNIKGLAGTTATKAQTAGWNIFKTDNWHGSVDASTVYFGPRMKAAAQLLAADLGITRVKPSFAPMNPRMLTVILTVDYH